MFLARRHQPVAQRLPHPESRQGTGHERTDSPVSSANTSCLRASEIAVSAQVIVALVLLMVLWHGQPADYGTGSHSGDFVDIFLTDEERGELHTWLFRLLLRCCLCADENEEHNHNERNA